MRQKINLFWFRRDLRLDDNAGLYHALQAGLRVVPVFIFDTNILDELEDRDDRRVNFIHHTLVKMQEQLQAWGSSLDVRYGKPLAIIEDLVKEYDVHCVFTNHDYEPYARTRDEYVRSMLEKKGIGFISYKDQVILEKDEVVKEDGLHYSVFTPYSRKWLSLLSGKAPKSYPSLSLKENFFLQEKRMLPSLKTMGFVENDDIPKLPVIDEEIIRHYHSTRNTPSVQGTSRISMHLRFGTVSIRKLVTKALSLNGVYLNELIWREFFMQLLWHRPYVVTQSCKKEYDHIKWRNNEKEFELWCDGKTGYPIVDAGMRELNSTGFMHNRVRMITASFLVKHLLIDWRWGESYFARRLLDYELSSNNGNWQWVAGCGCDAAPYFRIFSPDAQTKKFDPQAQYIKKWVPEYDSLVYPLPMANHEVARERCLKAYKAALVTKG